MFFVRIGKENSIRQISIQIYKQIFKVKDNMDSYVQIEMDSTLSQNGAALASMVSLRVLY
jgi:hypothetical protein